MTLLLKSVTTVDFCHQRLPEVVPGRAPYQPVTDVFHHIPGYSLFCRDRNRCGGGVAIYCADHLPCCVLSSGVSTSGVEFLWVSIKSAFFHPSLALGCFHRPPSSSAQSVHDVCDNIESVMVSRKRACLWRFQH